MSFAQVLVLEVVICVSIVECVVALSRASVKKAQVGVPSELSIMAAIRGAMSEADRTGNTVNISISGMGTNIVYIPADVLAEGDDEECSTE